MAELDLQRRRMYLPRRDEPRARAGLRERHEAQLAADGTRVERDRQPDRDEPVGPVPVGPVPVGAVLVGAGPGRPFPGCPFPR